MRELWCINHCKSSLPRYLFLESDNFFSFRRIPEGTGWILDSFPTTYSQAKLFEKALSGFDMNKKESIQKSGGKGKKSTLAPDPRPPPQPIDPISGIDIVVLFDCPDDICLKRSAGRTCKYSTDRQYNILLQIQ